MTETPEPADQLDTTPDPADGGDEPLGPNEND